MWKTGLYPSRTGRSATAQRTAGRSRRDGRPRRRAFRIEYRNGKVKLGTHTDFALDPDSATVGLHQMLGDGQAQTGAPGLARARYIDAIKTLEDSRLVRLRDADTGVGHRKDHFVVTQLRAQHNLPVRQGVLDGVVQQVLQHLLDAPVVGRNFGQLARHIQGETQLLFDRATLRCLVAGFDQLRDAHRANLELQALGIHLRKLQEVFGEARQAARMFENDAQEASAVLRIVDGAANERFRKALNCGERGSKLVRNIRDEIAADTLELAQFRNIVKHDHRAGGFTGPHGSYGRGEVVLSQGAGGNFGLHARLAGKHAAYRFDQLGLAHHFEQRTTADGRYVEPQDRRKARIGENQPFGPVHDGDTFHHRAENRRGKISFLGQGTNGAIQTRCGLIERSAQRFERIPLPVGRKRPEVAL